ncbi:EXPA32 [Scenedesmus sp. PABB004]|nr:EXPA32 [Scenedesmus sp. PABB004]
MRTTALIAIHRTSPSSGTLLVLLPRIRHTKMAIALLLLASLVAAAAQAPAPAPAPAAAGGRYYRGSATLTNGPKGNDVSAGWPAAIPAGACGYGPLVNAATAKPGYKVVGLDPASPFAKRAMGGCGMCLEVTCNDSEMCDSTAPIVAQVVDRCAECAPLQVNLNARAFAELAPLDLGNVAVQYREVPCPFAGGIVVSVDAYRITGGGWVRLTLKNVAGAGDITSVGFQSAARVRRRRRRRGTGRAARAAPAAPAAPTAPAAPPTAPRAQAGTPTGVWRPMKNTFGAAWEASMLPALPLSLNVTNARGESVVLSSVITKAGALGEFPTTANFKA